MYVVWKSEQTADIKKEMFLFYLINSCASTYDRHNYLKKNSSLRLQNQFKTIKSFLRVVIFFKSINQLSKICRYPEHALCPLMLFGCYGSI